MVHALPTPEATASALTTIPLACRLQPVRNKGDAMRLPPPRVIHYAQPPLASPPPGPSPAPEELPQQLAADPLHRAALCPDMVHAIMLREPVSHVQSAINELILTYVRYIQHHREFANFVLHKDLEWVTQAAPALVENFQVRGGWRQGWGQGWDSAGCAGAFGGTVQAWSCELEGQRGAGAGAPEAGGCML